MLFQLAALAGNDAPKIADADRAAYWKDVALYNSAAASFQESLTVKQKQLLSDMNFEQQKIIEDQTIMAKQCGDKASFKADNANPRCEALPTK